MYGNPVSMRNYFSSEKWGMAANGLQICDGRAFQHKCSFGELHFL